MRPSAWIGLVLGLLGCHGDPPADPHEGSVSLGDRVTWARGARRDEMPVTTLFAEVVGPPDAVRSLSPPAAGRLASWAVAPGDAVDEGDVLAWWVSPGLSERAAAVTSAEAEVARARLEAEHAEAGAARGVRAGTDAALAAATLDAAVARRDALRRALDALRDTTVRDGVRWAWRSPASGAVQALSCAPGPVRPGDVCATLVADGVAEVGVAVPERHLGSLDGPVTGTFVAVDGREAGLRLAWRAPAIDRHDRTATLRFALDAPMTFGTSGRATLRVPSPDDVLAVPDAAITRVEGRPAVMRRTEDDRGEPVPVEVLGREPGLVHVRGLDAGDEVAVRGVFLLKSLASLDDEAGGHAP